jgi:hypothetical protein
VTEMKNVEYGMSVADKDGKSLGRVDYIIMDGWSGEPRKFMVRLSDAGAGAGALYFRPEDVAEVSGKKVKLNLAAEEVEKT